MQKNILIRIIVLFLLYSLTNPIQAQNDNGNITGRIVDSLSVKPIEYASIGLLNADSNKEVNGTTTDSKGNFIISNIKEGDYKLAIYIIGYRNKSISNIHISSAQRNIHLGEIKLANSSTNLKELTITAKSEIVEYKIDKIVYNAENDITSQGGTAIDVLKKVPQVNVDINGNVELEGNSNIRFLINGKPSSIFGNSLADALATIPASQIKNIEAITSPGAKYDAQGTGGIINIILKDNKVKGINGNMSMNAGTRFESGSANINFRNNNFGINAFFSGNAQISSHTPNSQDRVSMDSSTQTHLMQNGYTDFNRNSINSGVGFDWSINKKSNLTGGATYNQFENHNVNFLNQEQITRDFSATVLNDSKGYRNSTSSGTSNSLDFNLNYLKKFNKEGQELSITMVTSFGNPKNNYSQTQSNEGATTPYNGMQSSNLGTDNNLSVALDYVNPINDKVSIETGLKHVEQNINSSTNVSFYDPITNEYIFNASQSYHIQYNMKIYAAYASSNFSLFKWLNVKVGARTEYTAVNIDFPNTSVPSYNTLVPSIILSHKFKKEQQVKIAYTRRIERPEYMQINPFTNLSDPHNITTGNPNLRPEIGDLIEMAYNKTFPNGGNINISLNERINTQDLKQITTFYPLYQIRDSLYSNVSVTKIQNIGAEYNSGCNISVSYPIIKNFTFRTNISAFHRNIISPSLGNIDMGFRYRCNFNLMCQLPKNLVAEAFGNFNSATQNVQGMNPQSITYTFAFRKQFWNKKASFGFTATNPFNEYVQQITTTNTSNYSSYNIKQLPFRSFGISFTYKFGKLEFKKEKDENKNDYLNNLPN